MFEIIGVYAERFHPQGYVLRMKNSFRQHLNTEEGVKRVLDEEKPFAELKIVDYTTKEDLTKKFLGGS